MIDWPCHICLEIKVPGLGDIVLELEEPDRQPSVIGAIVVVEVLAHLGPVLHHNTVDGGRSLIGAVLLHPVVVHVMEGVLALAAPVVLWVLDVRPPVIREDHRAAVVHAERRVGEKAHLVGLRGAVLIPLCLYRRVVKV